MDSLCEGMFWETSSVACAASSCVLSGFCEHVVESTECASFKINASLSHRDVRSYLRYIWKATVTGEITDTPALTQMTVAMFRWQCVTLFLVFFVVFFCLLDVEKSSYNFFIDYLRKLIFMTMILYVMAKKCFYDTFAIYLYLDLSEEPPQMSVKTF